MGDIMKRLFIILLSVAVLTLAGCNSMVNEMTEADISYEETKEPEESKEPVIAEGSTVESSSENETEFQSNKDDAESSEASVKEETENQPVSESRENQTEQREDSPASTEQREETQPSVQTSEPTSEPTPEPTPEPEYTPAGYNPGTVVSLAIAKCQAGGMITTQDNLANALAEGRITQEEYNEYYPYDGLESSYYSVFVETDLNIASTTSGQPLRSEDAIATYIADMLLLESNPVFNVVYAGVYSRNGTDFYEFRCLR